MKEHLQQHRGVKPSTHIECGLIIHNGQLHNVGIHWLLKVGQKRRKKNGFKFSLQGKKNTIMFPSLHNHLGRISVLSHKTEYTSISRITAHAKTTRPGTCSPYWLSQAVSWFYWGGSFCPSTSSSVSLESGAAILRACYLWHTHSFAAGTCSETGCSIRALLSPFYSPCKDSLKQPPGRQDNILDSSAAGLESNTLFAPLSTGSL